MSRNNRASPTVLRWQACTGMKGRSMEGAEHPVFAGIDVAWRERIRREARVVTLPAGRKVFRPGDTCQGLPLVIEGRVRVQMTSESGHEIVLYRVGSAEVCTLSIGCLMAGRGYWAEAV
ncbi:MAG: cyclic nucleotide-binding domain-containing protein, partial [Halomonadaceae bacterium]|nr:cyclic nucleotide-binding domain-containing protein [Halomonadaceae bacterium]